MRAVGIVIAAFTTLIGLVSCADPAPSPPTVQPAPVSLRTATPFPLSSAIPVLTSHQGIAAISDTLGGAGFACTRNERFLSCRSATDGVRVSAFDQAGAAVEIDGVIFPNAPTDETNVLLAMLDQIAPAPMRRLAPTSKTVIPTPATPCWATCTSR